MSDTTMRDRASRVMRSTESNVEIFGDMLVRGFHLLALFAIGATIVWAGFHAFLDMAAQGRATIQDILLLFIYLELGAMVGIYFKTNHMPVRFLIYVAITALTRLMIESVNVEHLTSLNIVYISGAILLLALAILILRFGSNRFPSAPASDERSDFADRE